MIGGKLSEHGHIYKEKTGNFRSKLISPFDIDKRISVDPVLLSPTACRGRSRDLKNVVDLSQAFLRIFNKCVKFWKNVKRMKMGIFCFNCVLGALLSWLVISSSKIKGFGICNWHTKFWGIVSGTNTKHLVLTFSLAGPSLETVLDFFLINSKKIYVMRFFSI